MVPPVTAGVPNKVYDAAYFAKWYHNPRTKVHTAGAVRRKVRMALSVAEYFLRREVRTVLDIGSGEGAWRAELKRLRPDIRYQGIDPSDYVVQRFGRRRNIRLGRFEDVATMDLRGHFDLIVCADVLQYVSTHEVKRGVKRIASLLGGMAFLEAY